MKTELVLAIPSEKLWNILDYKVTGVINNTDASTVSEILAHSIFKRRDLLENDPTFKQIIPYAVICYCDEVYLFKRTVNQTEKRLHNLYSLGVGGHMNPFENLSGSPYLHHELERELREEVILQPDTIIQSIKPIGYINDDLNEVGKVHLGVLYEIRLSSKNIEINEKDKMTGNWLPNKNLAAFYHQMESWSKIYVDLLQ